MKNVATLHHTTALRLLESRATWRGVLFSFSGFSPAVSGHLLILHRYLRIKASLIHSKFLYSSDFSRISFLFSIEVASDFREQNRFVGQQNVKKPSKKKHSQSAVFVVASVELWTVVLLGLVFFVVNCPVVGPSWYDLVSPLKGALATTGKVFLKKKINGKGRVWLKRTFIVNVFSLLSSVAAITIQSV
jgi:hypothetical protein